jgi:hypothetical protein
MLVLALPGLDHQERDEGVMMQKCFHLSLRSERRAAWAAADVSAKRGRGHHGTLSQLENPVCQTRLKGRHGHRKYRGQDVYNGHGKTSVQEFSGLPSRIYRALVASDRQGLRAQADECERCMLECKNPFNPSLFRLD